MRRQECNIELLINPFCLCERDYTRLRGICEKHHIAFVAYNLWELDDADVEGLPGYMACLIKEWRTGQRGGSVYSNVFINGERFPIHDWPRSFDVIEQRLAALLEGKRHD